MTVWLGHETFISENGVLHVNFLHHMLGDKLYSNYNKAKIVKIKLNTTINLSFTLNPRSED
jgi:hypothetical protein